IVDSELVDAENLLPIVDVREAQGLDVALGVVQIVVAHRFAESVRAAVVDEGVPGVESALLGPGAGGVVAVQITTAGQSQKSDQGVGGAGNRRRGVVVVSQSVVLRGDHRVHAKNLASSGGVAIDVPGRGQNLAV